MSNETIINCSIASQKKMYGKRIGQTQVKFKFESDNSNIKDFIKVFGNPISTKPYYIDEKRTYEQMKKWIIDRCENLTENFEHNNWKFVWNPPKELM